MAFAINGKNMGEAFDNIPNIFYAAMSLSTIGDSIELKQLTLPKPKLAAVGEQSGDAEQDLRLLSDIKEGLTTRETGNYGKFLQFTQKHFKRISSAFFDIKGNLLKKTQSQKYTAVIDEKIVYGKRHWYLRMSNIDNPGSRSTNFIGVVDATAYTLNVNSSLGTCGWAITCDRGKLVKYCKEKQKGFYATRATFGANDLVRVTVDMKKRELSYAINGRDLGVAFNDIPEEVYPAFSMDTPNWTMEIVGQGKNFVFDPDRRGIVSLFDENKTALVTSDTWQTVHGSKELLPKSGTYTWEIKLHEFKRSKTESMVVGIVPANQSYLQSDPIAFNLQGYGLVVNNGRKLRVRYKGIAQSFAKEGYKKGDVLGVIWDSADGKLGYYKNKKFLGWAFSEMDDL
eukprot:674861-Amorphochlora_amoeboformis.AAC.1